MTTYTKPSRFSGYFRFGGYVFHVSRDPNGETVIKQRRKGAPRFIAPLPRELRDELLIV